MGGDRASGAEPAVDRVVVRRDPGLDQILDLTAEIEILGSGFRWAEGPVWIEDETGGYLLFSDIPRNSIMQWREGKGISLFMRPSGYTGVADYGREPGSNGLALDRQGRLILCEHGDRRVARLTRDGGKMTLADAYQGGRLNSPNDVVVSRNGDIYFTDPPYGLPGQGDDPRRELAFCGVYRLTTDGELALLTRELERPNGMAFSPDERTLYVTQSSDRHPILAAFPVLPDGSLGELDVRFDFSEFHGRPGLSGSPDGMKVDQHGNLFVTGPGGIYILTSAGKLLGQIRATHTTANCAWGDDGSTLYMTADSTLCRIRTRTRGDGWRY